MSKKGGSKLVEWVEFNPTMICQAPFCVKQPKFKGDFAGCSYCYAARGMPHNQKEVSHFKDRELSTEEIKCLFDQMFDLKIRRLCVLGGEPQLREDFNEIITYACKKIPVIHLSTNGVGTRRHREALLQIPILDVSLDCHVESMATWTRPPMLVKSALETIDLLYKDHPFLCINTVVTPFVLPKLWDFVNWAFAKKNIKKINLYPLLNENKKELQITKGQIREIALRSKKDYPVAVENYCRSGRHVVVDYDGSIVPCAAFLGSGVKLGTLNNLRLAIESDLMQKYSQYDFKRGEKSDFESQNCPGKKLYDSDWKRPNIPLKKEQEKGGSDHHCMRCGLVNKEGVKKCVSCDFNYFDTKSVGMVCSCFSLLNPKFFGKTAN